MKFNVQFFLLLSLSGYAVHAAANCFDMIKNGQETDVDCGGSDCWARCSAQRSCSLDADCESGACILNVCATSTPKEVRLRKRTQETYEAANACFNNVKDYGETDTDCGGPMCWARCSPGSKCKSHSDCDSSACRDGICSVSRFGRMLGSGSGSSGAGSGSSGASGSYAPAPSSGFSPSPSSKSGDTGPSPDATPSPDAAPSPASGSPAVAEKKLILESTLTITGIKAAEFTTEAKQEVATSIANALGVDADRVTIEEILDRDSTNERRRLASHATGGVIILYSVEIAEAGETYNSGFLARVEEKMETFDDDAAAVNTVLDQVAQSVGKTRSELQLTSGKVIETEGEPVKCKKDEKVENNKCVLCALDETNPAGDFASGPDTKCKKIVAEKETPSANAAFIMMLLVGSVFCIVVIYEVYTKKIAPKQKNDVDTFEMTKI